MIETDVIKPSRPKDRIQDRSTLEIIPMRASMRSMSTREAKPMLRFHFNLLIVVVAVLFLGATAMAQITGLGVISGTVTDPSGAVVPGARIIITDAARNVSISSVTNSSGYFEVNGLNPSTYKIQVTAQGLQTLLREGITLVASAHINVPLQLKVGRATEAVVVTADASLLNTENGSTGEVLTTKQLEDLPAVGSNPMELVSMAPGAQSPYPQTYTMGDTLSWPGISKFGSFGFLNANAWTIDGIPNMGNPRGNAIGLSSEETDEMKVDPVSFDAAFGHTMGLMITQTTKAGTNDWHGTIHDLYQANAWRAMTHFQGLTYRYQQSLHGCNNGTGSPADCLHLKYQYGNPGVYTNIGSASFGGPVFIPKLYNGRNKLFFLVFVDNDNQNTAGVGTVSIPTMQERSGDFSDLPATTSGIPASYIAACGAGTPYYGQYQLYNPFTVTLDQNGVPRRQPFCGNRLPSNLLAANSKMAAAYNSFLPTPTTNSPLGSNYTYTTLTPQTFRQFTTRVDYAVSHNDHLYFRWTREHLTQSVVGFAPNGADDRFQQKWIQLGGVGWNHIFNPNTDLSVTAGITNFKAACCTYGYDKYSPSSVGLPDYLQSYAAASTTLPILNASGYQQIGQMDNTPQIYRNLSVSGVLMHVQGHHTMRFGAEWQQQIFSQAAQGTPSGTYTFDDTYTQENNGTDNTYSQSNTGLSYAALLLGIPTTSAVELGAPSSVRTPYYALYAADTWRITHKLTLNPGLRFEYEFGPSEKNNAQIVGWDSTASLPIAGPANTAYAATLAAATPAEKAVLPASLSIQGGPVYAGVNGAPTRQFVNSYRFLPRLAAAYQISPKTVLRAGYGIFFDTINAHGLGGTPHQSAANIGGINQWGGVQFSTDQSGYSASTSVASSTTYGTNFVAGTTPLSDPFPAAADGSRFNSPIGNAAGAMYYVGSNVTAYDHSLVPARAQRWYVGMQHQFGASTLVEVAYLGQVATKLPLSVPASSLPASLYTGGTQPNTAMNTLLSSKVPNPFAIGNFGGIASSNPAAYQLMAHNSYFTSSTITVANLVKNNPQMSGLSLWRNTGEMKFQEVQVNATKRYSSGLTFITGLQLNDQHDRDYYANPFDPSPSWESSNNSTPYRVTAQAIYELPFGAGRTWVTSGWESKVFGGFQLAGTYERQSGWLITFNNLFYIGKPGKDIKLKHPVYVNNLASGGSAYVQWLNPGNVTTTYNNGVCSYSGTGFVTNPSCQPNSLNLRVFPTTIDGVRGPAIDGIQANLQRTFTLTDRFKLNARINAYNLLNRQYLGLPNVSPSSAQFGQVTTDGASSGPGNSRWLALEARLQF